MDIEIKKIFKALDLSEKWDEVALDYFQTREFLNHTELYNPCKQRYYLLYRQGVFETGVAVYTLKIDLLTYMFIRSPFRMNIAGIPCSVSASGIVGNPAYLHQIINEIKTREKGLLLFLNLTSQLQEENLVTGKTLPTVLITNNFRSWDDYLGMMKSTYRRRVRLLSLPFSGIKREQLACSFFDDRMYDLYLEVLKRSKGKLETLSLAFFRELSSNFNLTTFYSGEKLIGWYISATFKEKFYFFLGGLDYKVNRQFNTSFNILLNVVREGIEKRASVIDLGQTAEIPKLRLGGQLIEKTMCAHHSSRLMRLFLKAGKSLLEYSIVPQETHVFKEIK